MKPEIGKFADWFKSHAHRLYQMPSDEAAIEIEGELCRVDERLGVEVERLPAGDRRDIIFTAFSDPAAFPIVHAIAELAGQCGSWNVHALKPPRGFDFSISLNGQELRADRLRFRAISTVENGFELLCNNVEVSGDGAEEAAWLIVETGVGEELAGIFQHLEFGDATDARESKPIAELANTLRSV